MISLTGVPLQRTVSRELFLMQTCYIRFSDKPELINMRERYILEYSLPSERFALVTQLSLKENAAMKCEERCGCFFKL